MKGFNKGATEVMRRATPLSNVPPTFAEGLTYMKKQPPIREGDDNHVGRTRGKKPLSFAGLKGA